jgi:uncharacterized membrane protein YgcG
VASAPSPHPSTPPTACLTQAYHASNIPSSTTTRVPALSLFARPLLCPQQPWRCSVSAPRESAALARHILRYSHLNTSPTRPASAASAAAGSSPAKGSGSPGSANKCGSSSSGGSGGRGSGGGGGERPRPSSAPRPWRPATAAAGGGEGSPDSIHERLYRAGIKVGLLGFRN